MPPIRGDYTPIPRYVRTPNTSGRLSQRLSRTEQTNYHVPTSFHSLTHTFGPTVSNHAHEVSFTISTPT